MAAKAKKVSNKAVSSMKEAKNVSGTRFAAFSVGPAIARLIPSAADAGLDLPRLYHGHIRSTTKQQMPLSSRHFRPRPGWAVAENSC
jgi:hypothetical protein